MSRRPLTSEDVLARLRAACDGAGGQRAWSRRHGLSQTHVSQVLSGDKRITDRVARPLGLSERTVWVPAEEGRP